MGRIKNHFHDEICARQDCRLDGHLPSEVEHLKGHYTRLTCPRCGKSVIEHGLSDHPLATAPNMGL
jgi:hypothetical protein